MRRKPTFHPDEFQLRVVKEYLSTTQSQRDLQVKYNIRSHGSIPRWMLKFGYKLVTNVQPKLQFAMGEGKEKSQKELELEEELRKLKGAFEFEQLRSQALTTMIDVAERELKISIRKKSGAKQ